MRVRIIELGWGRLEESVDKGEKKREEREWKVSKCRQSLFPARKIWRLGKRNGHTCYHTWYPKLCNHDDNHTTSPINYLSLFLFSFSLSWKSKLDFFYLYLPLIPLFLFSFFPPASIFIFITFLPLYQHSLSLLFTFSFPLLDPHSLAKAKLLLSILSSLHSTLPFGFSYSFPNPSLHIFIFTTLSFSLSTPSICSSLFLFLILSLSVSLS